MSQNPKSQAAEYARMLLSTGMAHEFQPETIATRAFLDGFALGASDIASVTAERDKAHRIAKHPDTVRLGHVVRNMTPYDFVSMPEDFGQAREFIDSLIAAMKGGAK